METLTQYSETLKNGRVKMSTVSKSKKGYSVIRVMGEDGKDIPQIKLIKGYGLKTGCKYKVTQSLDAKKVTIEIIEKVEP